MSHRLVVGSLLAAGLWLAAGCTELASPQCIGSEECGANVCIAGRCVPPSTDTGDDDAAIDADAQGDDADGEDDLVEEPDVTGDPETDVADVEVDSDATPDDADVEVDGDAEEDTDVAADDADTDDGETSTEPVCGDGEVGGDEACDDGDANSDTESDACRTDCTTARCGDGVQDSGEECDDGDANSDTESNACRTSCRAPFCGDGIVDESEACDGSTDCTDTCELADRTCTTCGEDAACGLEQRCAPDLGGDAKYCLTTCDGDVACASGTTCVTVVHGAEEVAVCVPRAGRCGDVCLSQEVCGTGVDDDCDGAIDCADDDCSDASLCATEVCSDRIDNDGDGRIDCADTDCETASNCACSDLWYEEAASGAGMEVTFNQGGDGSLATCGLPATTAGGRVVTWVAPADGRYVVEIEALAGSGLVTSVRFGDCLSPAFACATGSSTSAADIRMQRGEALLVRVSSQSDNARARIRVRAAELSCRRNSTGDTDGDGVRGCDDSDCNGWGECRITSECAGIVGVIGGCPSGTSCVGRDCVCSCASGVQCAPGQGRCTDPDGCCAVDANCLQLASLCGG